MPYHSTCLLVFCPLILCFAYAPLSGQTSTWESSAEALIQAAVTKGDCIGIAAGFQVGDDVTWTSAAGLADSESGLLFEAVTPTRIASLTKPFTALAIMQLYEKGRLDLDTPIQKYLPWYPTHDEGIITIRHLLGHTSGIGDYRNDKERENFGHYTTIQDAVHIFDQRELLFTPGTEFHYTTYGYDVLGAIIEAITGMSYAAYLDQNLFKPAGMHDTGIEDSQTAYPGKSALYHRQDNGKVKPAKPTDLSDRIQGGGIYSTVNDMLKFGQAILNNALIQGGTLDLMLSDQGVKTEGNAYGLGFYLYGINPSYGNVIGHTGTQTGCSAMLMLLPERETTIVVLSNTSGTMQTVSQTAIQLFDIAAQAATH